MCFVHVLLNALDMQERGYEVKVILEGSATNQTRNGLPCRSRAMVVAGPWPE